MEWKTRILKRAIDVAGAGIGLAIAAPLFPVVAAAVKLTSPGPIFYTQVRCGAERRSDIASPRPSHLERRRDRGYHTFRIIKFRTMAIDAEKHTGAVLATKNDPRLTPIGGLLRKTRLDELPQLWNVLLGEMSLVGPRPERPELLKEIEESVPFFSERMRLIKPGLTGLAQIKLNYDGSFRKPTPEMEALRGFTMLELPSLSQYDNRLFGNKLLYDLSYSAALENPFEWFKMDVRIMLQTPVVMLLARGT
jgi:lipopolysaccharide/colanic/teichoic acid biosynthesis glycosyltransferase